MKHKTKVKLIDIFIRHRNYFQMGQNFVYLAKTTIQILIYGGAALFLFFDYRLPALWAGITGMVFIIMCWIVGKYLDKIGFYHREAEFNNKRNYFVEEMRNEIKKKKRI